MAEQFADARQLDDVETEAAEFDRNVGAEQTQPLELFESGRRKALTLVGS